MMFCADPLKTKLEVIEMSVLHGIRLLPKTQNKITFLNLLMFDSNVVLEKL